MFALVALLFLHCAQARSAAATIEHSFRKVESVSGIVCPEEHTMFEALALSAVVCAWLCSSVGDGCRGVNFNLTSHACLGCNTSDLSSTASSEAQSEMVFLKKYRLMWPQLVTIPRQPQSAEVNAAMVGTIDVRTADDRKTCYITGSVVLPDDRLVLADFNNNKIKLVNLQTSKVTSQLDVSYPWDMAIITDNQMAVTLYNDQKIVFVTVTSVLKLDREMRVDQQGAGIVYNNDRLVIGFRYPAKIIIMTINGTVEKTIELSSSSKFPEQIALNPTKDAIYVSSYDEQVIKRIGLDGEVEAEYEDEQLRNPDGMIVDQQGRVIVCGYASDNIHLFTADLAKIKLLVEEIDHPTSLSLCHSTSRLYVGSMSDDVSVYQLS